MVLSPWSAVCSDLTGARPDQRLVPEQFPRQATDPLEASRGNPRAGANIHGLTWPLANPPGSRRGQGGSPRPPHPRQPLNRYLHGSSSETCPSPEGPRNCLPIHLEAEDPRPYFCLPADRPLWGAPATAPAASPGSGPLFPEGHPDSKEKAPASLSSPQRSPHIPLDRPLSALQSPLNLSQDRGQGLFAAGPWEEAP